MWQDMANNYSRELQQGVAQQGQQQMQQAELPLSLFDRFQEAYQKQMMMKKQEEAMRRQEEHIRAREALADRRYESEALNKMYDDIQANYVGDPEQEAAFIARGSRMGQDAAKIKAMLPQGKLIPDVKAYSLPYTDPDRVDIGRVDPATGETAPGETTQGESLTIPYPAEINTTGKIVPRSNWGAGARLNAEGDEQDRKSKSDDLMARLRANDLAAQALAQSRKGIEDSNRLSRESIAAGKNATTITVNTGDNASREKIAAERGKNKTVPAHAAKAYAANQEALGNFEEFEKHLAGMSDAEIEKAIGLKAKAGDLFMQRWDDTKKGNTLRALISKLGGIKLHELSGGAVTIGEASRLMPMIPTGADTPTALKSKVKVLRAEIERANNTFYDDGGASAPAAGGGGGTLPEGLKGAPQVVIDAYNAGKTVSSGGKKFKK